MLEIHKLEARDLDLDLNTQSKTETFRLTTSKRFAEIFSSQLLAESNLISAPIVANSMVVDAQSLTQHLQMASDDEVVSSSIDFLASNLIASSITETTTVIPKIAINDAIGPAGAQELALPFPAVVGIGDASFGLYCSGSLIAPDVVLSARHCDVLAGDQVFFGADTNNPELVVNVESVELPDGPGTLLDGGDVSILHLDQEVPESIATPLRLTSQTDELVGQKFTLIGYGLHGVGSTGATMTDGLRWAGENIIDAYGPPVFFNGENQFSADFDDGSDFANMIPGSSPDPIEYEAAPAVGDSGGPILVETQAGEYVIAGVLSGGTTPTGMYGDVSWWTGTARFETEITDVGGVFVTGAPETDDHADSISQQPTELNFQLIGTKFIARDVGFLGYGETVLDTDVFSFVINSPGRVIIDGRENSGGVDMFTQLFNEEGELFAENDDSNNPAIPNPSDSQIVIDNLDSGKYFVAVSSTVETFGSYRLSVRYKTTDPGGGVGDDDYGSSFGSAEEIGLAAPPNSVHVKGTAEFGDDDDFFVFQANHTGELTVRTRATSGNLNTVLRSYDEGRTLLDANNNYKDSLDSRIRFNVVEGEQYFVRLSSVRDTTGDYRISLRMKTDDPNGLSRKVVGPELVLDNQRDSNDSNLHMANNTDLDLVANSDNSLPFEGFLT